MAGSGTTWWWGPTAKGAPVVLLLVAARGKHGRRAMGFGVEEADGDGYCRRGSRRRLHVLAGRRVNAWSSGARCRGDAAAGMDDGALIRSPEVGLDGGAGRARAPGAMASLFLSRTREEEQGVRERDGERREGEAEG